MCNTLFENSVVVKLQMKTTKGNKIRYRPKCSPTKMDCGKQVSNSHDILNLYLL